MATTRGLYAILCFDACARRGLPPREVGRALLEAGPAFFQVRAKDRSSAEVLPILHEMRTLTRERGIPFFVNDRADWAASCGADGVHVGQGDLPVAAVHARFPQLAVGVSTHDEVQLRAAIEERPRYVALGPIFATASKAHHERPLGLSELERLARLPREAGLPLVAIGGLEGSAVGQALAAADAAALISALLPEPGEPASGGLQQLVLARVQAAFGARFSSS